MFIKKSKFWFCVLTTGASLIFGPWAARSQQVFNVRWSTTHGAPPATLPGVSPTALAAYRMGLVFAQESNVVDLVISQNALLGISTQQADHYKQVFGERYHLISVDPVFQDAQSALSYCFSADTPTQGLAVVYAPKRFDPNLSPLVFLHGYGGSFLWSQHLLAEYFPNRLIICPAFGISSAGMPPAYISECLRAVKAKVARPLSSPILIGLSMGGFGAARIFTQTTNQFSRLIVLGAYPPQDTLAHFNKGMSVRFMAGAKEDFVQSGTFTQYTQAVRPRPDDLETKIIPDGDHFFLLEKREEAMKLLQLWIDSPAGKPPVKKKRN